MAKQYPATLYVKICQDGRTEYFQADAEAALLVEMGEKIKLAKYKLVEVSEAEGVAQFRKARR